MTDVEALPTTQVYLGVGSNINPKENVDKALRLFEEAVGTICVSPIYKNPAQGFDGDDFLNLVVSFKYNDNLAKLRKTMDRIEQQCGRQRHLETGKGSRNIDIDLLLFGDLEGEYDGIKLPRSDVFERQFVWQPLLDLFSAKSGMTELESVIKKKIESKLDRRSYPALTVYGSD